MEGLFPDEKIRNKKADEPWKKSETDHMLDAYFMGKPPDRIAILLERNPKAVKRRLEQFSYNERDRAVKYHPKRRVSRRGQRFTENERELLRCHREREIDPEVTAKVLQRKVSEVEDNFKAKGQAKKMMRISPDVDLLLAHRYLYYVKNTPVISDTLYDDLEKEALEFSAHSQVLLTPGSDNPDDYEDRIKALAIYIALTYGKKGGSTGASKTLAEAERTTKEKK